MRFEENNNDYRLDGKILTKDEVLAFFNDQVAGAPAHGREKLAVDMLAKYLGNSQTLLDIGCYLGTFSEFILDKAPALNVIGVDYYSDNIRMAKLFWPNRQEFFMQQSVYKLEFPPESFDIVTFKEVIEHIDRPIEAIREINRVLKPGGLLLIGTPNANARAWNLFPYSLLNLVQKRKPSPAIFFEDIEWNRHIYSWTPKTLYTLLKVNGFDYVDHQIHSDSFLGKLFPAMAENMIFLVQKIAKSPETII